MPAAGCLVVMPDRDASAKEKPRGPFSPPYPKTAEKGGDGEPMAVANDKANTHGESFVATSSADDQFDHDVAKKYAKDVDEPKREKETRAAQKPEGFTEPDEQGWSKLKEQNEEE